MFKITPVANHLQLYGDLDVNVTGRLKLMNCLKVYQTLQFLISRYQKQFLISRYQKG